MTTNDPETVMKIAEIVGAETPRDLQKALEEAISNAIDGERVVKWRNAEQERDAALDKLTKAEKALVLAEIALRHNDNRMREEAHAAVKSVLLDLFGEDDVCGEINEQVGTQ